jgi:hypothetical protein
MASLQNIIDGMASVNVDEDTSPELQEQRNAYRESKSEFLPKYTKIVWRKNTYEPESFVDTGNNDETFPM